MKIYKQLDCYMKTLNKTGIIEPKYYNNYNEYIGNAVRTDMMKMYLKDDIQIVHPPCSNRPTLRYNKPIELFQLYSFMKSIFALNLGWRSMVVYIVQKW